MSLLRAHTPGAAVHVVLREREDGDEASREHGGGGVRLPLNHRPGLQEKEGGERRHLRQTSSWTDMDQEQLLLKCGTFAEEAQLFSLDSALLILTVDVI